MNAAKLSYTVVLYDGFLFPVIGATNTRIIRTVTRTSLHDTMKLSRLKKPLSSVVGQLKQFSLRTMALTVLLACCLLFWYGPKLRTVITEWFTPQPRGIAALIPPGHRVYSIACDSDELQALAIQPGDVVNVLCLPDDGSLPQTILESVQVIGINQTLPPNGLMLLVTPQQAAMLAAHHSRGTITCRPVRE